jgi:hypothetical protein
LSTRMRIIFFDFFFQFQDNYILFQRYIYIYIYIYIEQKKEENF